MEESVPSGTSTPISVPPDAPETINHSLGPGPNNWAEHPPVTIGHLPPGYNLKYVATTSGVLTGTWHGPTAKSVTPIGPTGLLQSGSCTGYLKLQGLGFSGPCGGAPVPRELVLRDSVVLSRATGPAHMWYVNGQVYCGTMSCVTYSGAHAVTLSRMAAEMTLTATETRTGTRLPAMVRYNSIGSFLAGRTPETVPHYPLGATWTPDGGMLAKSDLCTGAANRAMSPSASPVPSRWSIT